MRTIFMTVSEMILNLFDGEGGGDGGAMGDATGMAAAAQAANGESMTDPSAGDTTGSEEPPEKTPEERYREFIESDEMREIHQKDFQQKLNRRFKQVKGLEAQLNAQQPIMDMLAQRGINDMDKLNDALRTSSYWSDAAEAAGMTDEQYAQFQSMDYQRQQAMEQLQSYQQAEADRQQAQKWFAEARELKGKYSNFDVAADLNDPNFVAMLQSGASMETAFKAKHFDDIMSGAIKETQKKVADNIRAKGQRPTENGTKSQGAFTTKTDPTKMTEKDFDDILARVRRGERIEL